jgi:hypothetical protein
MSATDSTQVLGVVQGTPAALGAGAVPVLLTDRFGAVLDSPYRAKYAQMTGKNMVFCTNTAAAGTTIVAANASPPAAAAATILSLYNPVGNTYDFEIIMGQLTHVSGTPGAGMFQWCVSRANTAALTASTTTAAAPVACRGGISTAKAFTQAAVTGGLIHVALRNFPAGSFAGAIAATTPGQNVIDQVDGSIVLAPGDMVTIANAATGTTHIVAASITWAEVPISGTGGV